MKLIPCNNCNSTVATPVLKKASSSGEEFQIVKCISCNLVYVNPQPDPTEVKKYYSNEYFTKRTDRGYDNYYSDPLRQEIERVFRMNLADLGYYEFEKPGNASLDVGCAAGYFVSFMKSYGWDAMGIDIAEDPIKYAKNVLGVNVVLEDFLDWDQEAKSKFNLITLWASLEHLHKPKETLQKIFMHLKPGGSLILSTCRYGWIAKFRGVHWRYLNVPEHLYYYTLPLLRKQCCSIGFKHVAEVTYGSGMTSIKNAGAIYKLGKKILDPLVKFTNQGDMMALRFSK